ncbi:Bifunctional dethiobiotin synthetase/7,8-diamino-pelargonic acid aminotransferase, mitochondrial [Cytospora mali]|uniref:Bifunctional dethiobiotin synthetase/7,8-diamino-pelargonic acid aminotransferase, mitochondrial n=1 Tax=Cytospora mali TaxID=578113 RepID=A0A194WCS9_CYTMA|nr:Bifunctional dethiobiotin synthetase/7,8-diamino-pelargonic acid aminotransferase, mitochondrial [Valsa mali]
MAPVGSILSRSLRVHQVYGANTDVGKTILTTLLCRASRELWSSEQTCFLKPVSTGPEDEADTRHVALHAPGVSTTTLLQYSQPISPHAAAQGKNAPSDTALLSLIHANCSAAASAGPGWLFLETAGGVHSPSPSGTTQADLYSPLRLPVVLVGDAKLGGISLTISAFEALRIRGYDVESILMFENNVYENDVYLREYFGERFGVPVMGVEAPPERARDQRMDQKRMMSYYAQASARGTGVLKHLAARHVERIKRLESMATEAHRTIWYPFTQQKLLSPENITAIDSAKGDFFQTLVPQAPAAPSASKASSSPGPGTSAAPLLQPSFDGSASWWTQGLGHGAPSLTLAAAYAAGRYGHVMFAEAVHEPTLGLAQALLGGMHRAGNDRLTRVFYSDNGSTGVEVALKMALKAAGKRYGWARGGSWDSDGDQPPAVVGLRGGYHGDTLGAMECAEPSIFNSKVD